jgi:5-formyltetrahydrofolate cyclo-ligase
VAQAVDEVRASKEALRSKLRRERLALSPAEVRAASAAVCALVEALPAFQRARSVAIYGAIQNEIDPAPLAARVPRVAYPRIERRQPATLAFHLVSDPASLAADAWGIPTPLKEAPLVPLAELDVLLVPALAFDRAGHRLGYGRGYYDAALAAAPRALRIGLGHSFQLLDRLPRHDADQPVDFVVTPTGVHATGARPELGPLEAR